MTKATKNLMLDMLRKGKTGDEILMILDAITNDIEQEETEEDSE